ncbi:MAG: type II toxin-antitoxin system RelE/ParE family toxin [Syntrophales bacterium LBB04]|nr:type II toxin-antitoxin system RelE/ParE family toxin [Syntrophales bacterium LBB04]
MSKYAITFARSARKELEVLDVKVVNRIFPKIENLSIEPRPAGCRKLTGNKHLWRIRVGDYRIIYSINDDKNLVDIIAVRDRKEAYK